MTRHSPARTVALKLVIRIVCKPRPGQFRRTLERIETRVDKHGKRFTVRQSGPTVYA